MKEIIPIMQYVLNAALVIYCIVWMGYYTRKWLKRKHDEKENAD